MNAEDERTNGDDSEEEEWEAMKRRREEKLNQIRAKLRKRDAAIPPSIPSVHASKTVQPAMPATQSLLATKLQLDKTSVQMTPEEMRKAQEDMIVRQIEMNYARPLRSVKELSRGSHYNSLMMQRLLNWTVPKGYDKLKTDEVTRLMKRLGLKADLVSNMVPPIKSFRHMRLPRTILTLLAEKKIDHPTPIQQIALPNALAGRDIMAVAHTGSGKSLIFLLPITLICCRLESILPLKAGEGPLALLLCPSRELATQSYDNLTWLSEGITQHLCVNRIRSALCIGGLAMKEQAASMMKGAHVCIGTPGRISDLLDRRVFLLHQCVYVVLDEADRLLDFGFEDTVRAIYDHMGDQRQTLLFSATMPAKVREFAETALNDPVVIVAGRAGAANKNVRQRVEYVKANKKYKFILRALQDTPPPTMVFCSNREDVDRVTEYLLIKGVEAVPLHGGLSQIERAENIAAFKEGSKDVLVASDVASKGLDFPNIQHVINADLPDEIENYIHRIGRTGRSSQGLATTFVSSCINEAALLDLRGVLLEANQEVPKFLNLIAQAAGIHSEGGCIFCGGPGHTVLSCPKLATHKAKQGRDILNREAHYGSSHTAASGW